MADDNTIDLKVKVDGNAAKVEFTALAQTLDKSSITIANLTDAMVKSDAMLKAFRDSFVSGTVDINGNNVAMLAAKSAADAFAAAEATALQSAKALAAEIRLANSETNLATIAKKAETAGLDVHAQAVIADAAAIGTGAKASIAAAAINNANIGSIRAELSARKANEALLKSQIEKEQYLVNVKTLLIANSLKAADSQKLLAGATSATIREFIVLGREAITGNFSRIPGSLLILAKSMGNVEEMLPRIITGLKIFAGIKLTEELMKWDEEFGKIAEKIELVSAETGLSTDQVQQMSFAMDMIGQKGEAATRALEQLDKHIVDASHGRNQAALDFKAMGISLTDLATGKLKDMPTILAEVATYFNKTADGAEKTNLAIGIGGRNFATMIPYLNLGTKGMEEFKKALADTNSEMSKADLQKFSGYARSTTILAKAWEGLKLQLAGAFEPIGEEFVKAVTWLIEKFTELFVLIGKIVDYLERMPKRENFWYGDDVKEMESGDGKPKAATPQTVKEIEDAKRSAAERIKITRDTEDGRLAILKEKGDAAVSMLDESNRHSLAMYKETQKEFLQNEKHNLDTRYILDTGYYDAKLAADEEYYKELIANANGDALEIAKLEEKKTKDLDKTLLERQKLQDKYELESKKLSNKIDEDNAKNKIAAFESIASGFQSMTEKLIRGTATFRDAFKTMCGDLIVEFAKFTVKYIALKLQASAIDKLTAAEGVATALWASGVKMAIEIKDAIFTRGAKAVEAAAATFASVAEIPGVGWALAPAAAAGAFAGVMAFGLPSAAGGWGEVPQDGIAMIHKKEMVLPAPLAEKVRNMTDGGSGGGNTYHFNISALDGNSVKDMFMKHGGAIVSSMNNQSRNLNPHVMGAR